MIKKYSKKLLSKGIACAISILPTIVPILLIVNANSVASVYNVQPKPPSSIEKYKRFKK